MRSSEPQLEGGIFVFNPDTVRYEHMKRTYLLTALIGLLFLGAGCTASSPTTRTSPDTNGAPAAETKTDTSTTLNLSGTALTSVPPDIFKRTGLQSLDLSNNNLTGSIPAEIRHLQNLRSLDASDNQMTGVPAEIGQLTELRDLDLSNNALTGLPNELGNLKNLVRFDLRGNNISKQDLDGIRAKLTNTEILE